MNRVAGDDGSGRRFDSGFTRDFITEDIENALLYSSFAPWNKIFRRSIIGELRFPEGITYEDFALIPQIINRANRIAYTNEVLYHYYLNPNSVISLASAQKKTNRDILKAQHVLEHSDIKTKPAVLENFYIRRVLSSMAWTLLEYKEGKTEVANLVDEAFEKYPNIKNNPYISNMPFVKRVFIRLILDKKITIAGYWVGMYSFMRFKLSKLK